jgi:hypothetical protein
MTGDEPTAMDPTSGLRRESEVEFLDDKQAVRGPLPQLTGVRWYRRTLRVIGLLAVAALSAVYAAAATHSSDIHGNASGDRAKVALQLVGGSATLNTEPGSWTPDLVAGILKFTVRNDGPLSVDVVMSGIKQPGIAVTRADGDITVTPGEQSIVIIDVNVDCENAQLASQPDALHLTVRTKDGHVHPVTLPVAQTHQAPNAIQLQAAAATLNDQGSYFVLCGQAVNQNSPTVDYRGLLTTATPTNPVFSYHASVTNHFTAPMMLAPSGLSLPGVQTAPSITAPRQLAAGASTDLTVGFRITSCSELGKYLSGFQGMGAGLAAEAAGNTVVTATVADKRFPSLPQPVDVMQSSPNGSSVFYTDIIGQFIAACPALR